MINKIGMGENNHVNPVGISPSAKKLNKSVVSRICFDTMP